MEKGIAVLRGINVSGHRLIKMEALRSMLGSLGLKDVQTYIQSGNLVFKTRTLKDLEKKMSEKILEDFGYDVPSLVWSMADWQAMVKANPYPRDTDADLLKCHVTLLWGKPESGSLEKKIPESGTDNFRLVDRAIYLYAPGGYGKTKYSNTFFEKRTGCLATTRNWKTILTLLEMCEKLEE